jgi:acetyl/propionyl-CoA carboxylase alpha subunit
VLESAIPARRVTVGVIADGTSAIHLGDHECTLHRGGRTRVRESPAPALDEPTRGRLSEAAVRLAEGLGLVGVAAVEFLVEDHHWWVHDVIPGLFEGYSLHDEVYGLELAPTQVRIASGETLGWEQSEIHPAGVGIELLVCATGAGTIERLSLPEAAATHLGEGAVIDPARDPVLARLQVTGPMRHAALVRARASLGEIEVEGVPTDTALLADLLGDTRMWEGHLDTDLLDRLDRKGV